MKVKSWFLIVLYLIAFLALFPILQFEYFRFTPVYDQATSFWVWFRIFLSGPLMLAIGTTLVFLLKGKHRVFGIICLLVGLYWIIGILKDIIAEIRIF